MKSNAKTFIILTPGFAKDESDTVCIPTQQHFIKALEEMHPELKIIILALEYPFIRRTYEWFGNTVICFKGVNKDIRKLFLRRRVAIKLKELNNQYTIVGLLSFWCNECALIAKSFGDKNNIRHVCWIWGQDAKKENRYPKRITPRDNELATLSDFLQAEFEKNHGIRPKHVVPPGIDHRQYNVSEQRKDIDVLAAGSLIPLKQFEIFIDVIDKVRDILPGVKAVLIGKGAEKDKLISLIENKGLAENIIWTGELPHNEVLTYMKRAKVFLHPSSYEGFGIVCIEALGAGADVISFVKPMNREIENWHIVKNKEEMLKKTLGVLLDQEKEYRSVIPYTIEATAQQMGELFSL